MPSRNESLASPPSHVRQRLAALVQAYDQGLGPVEQETLRRLTLGLPTTPLQMRAFSEECYPDDVRRILDGLGYQSLYERDINRALSLCEGVKPTPPAAETIASNPRPRSIKRQARGPIRLRIVVFAMAALFGALILLFAFPRLQRDQDLPVQSPTDAEALPPARPAEERMCLQLLRSSATEWCEGALTGSRALGRIPQEKLEACGDRLRSNGDTVRFALDRILDDDAAYTYDPAEVHERCAAAAKLAVPG